MSDSGSQSSKKGFWHNPTVVALAPILVSWLLTKIEDVKLEWAWTWIPEWIVSVGRWFNAPIGIKPAWMISAVALVYLMSRLIKKFASLASTEAPDFLNYMTDRIDGLQWKWKWRPDRSGTYDMTEILALCPQCSYPMVWTFNGYGWGRSEELHCEECKHSQALDTSRSDTENRIRRRVGHTLEQRDTQSGKKNG
ncbi:hypothetical protein A9P79_17800 [Cupriavidus taiwanensis]|uniref:hypothetical protein n=1 Tax=Cupriavidus taiwanensis TaxID=164546 RepID=UPI001F01FC9D|nr:hypothetical protein [Cupriavidus taiwanensis]ULX53803.1 hypothetical protein A9P79_17800 [Cupriavidus taiwanensis]